MLAIGLALQVLGTTCWGAGAPAAPAPPATFAPPAAFAPPAPVVDGPAEAPVWIEFAVPASAPRSHEARSETLIVVPHGTVLELRNLDGDISIEGWPRSAVHVVAEHGRGDHLEARIENRVLVLDTRSWRHRPVSVDYRIQVPRWMALRLSGLDTDISVDGVSSPISAESLRGDVEVNGGDGGMQVSSVEGRVMVQDARGPVQAASVNSLVQLLRVAGRVQVQSVNGNIDLRQVDSPSVDASSVNGSVVFASPFLPRGRYRLASHNGDLQIGVPEDAGVDVSVASYFGTFETGFPLRLGPLHRGRRFGFTLGHGGSTLELESFQGMIQLLRPGALPAPAAPQAPRVSHEAPEAPPAPSPEDR